ncbi:hypothetical protein SAMN05216480_12714 [Pustulibacterium marinum]|uniref:Bacteroides conjugative transposon TraK protein n=1 Tax=Pustulibacterium marinum TaxID=1224947 RepID=A0A1I7IZX8_9FLAO|nr:conjugal transfer protein TraK [Pustulibacterium marinum]SFU78480.1 hypothetical protein SAMN05216480_12714 [Pustulibacterium marinum]
MKNPYPTIYDVLQKHRWIVLILVIGSFVTVLGSVGFVVYSVQQSKKEVFVLSPEGAVIPLRLEELRKYSKVEALAQLEQFHHLFYGLEAGNYEKRIEKALWLGDQTVSEVYQQKRSEGVYNRLLQYSLVQRVLSVRSEIYGESVPFGFRTVVLFEIKRGTVTDTYELVTTGKLIGVDRSFPENPHGLLLTEFYEQSLRKLTEEEVSNLNEDER